MEQTKKSSGETLYKVFIYLALILLAVTIIVPVAWVFMASIKQNSEFYGPGRCLQAFIFRTLRMPGVRRGWASLC